MLRKNLLKIFKKFFNFFLKKIPFGYLNKLEKEGNVSHFTKVKFHLCQNIKVPFSLGRTVRGVSFDDRNNSDKFHELILDLVNGGDEEKMINEYYKVLLHQKTLSSADILYCNCNSTLKKYPSWAHIMPWDDFDIEYKYRSYINYFKKNREPFGAKFDKLNLKSFDEAIFSKSNAKSQIFQTKKLLMNIKENGYKFNSDLPHFLIFINGKNWRWYMSTEGNHRAYLCYILGHNNFFGVIDKVINKKDINSWHNVKNAIYTYKEAENLFDNIFNGSKIIRGYV